jgi:hypothetical protein
LSTSQSSGIFSIISSFFADVTEGRAWRFRRIRITTRRIRTRAPPAAPPATAAMGNELEDDDEAEPDGPVTGGDTLMLFAVP